MSKRNNKAKYKRNGKIDKPTVKPDPIVSDPATNKPDPITAKPDPATDKPDPITAKPDPATDKPDPITANDLSSTVNDIAQAQLALAQAKAKYNQQFALAPDTVKQQLTKQIDGKIKTSEIKAQAYIDGYRANQSVLIGLYDERRQLTGNDQRPYEQPLFADTMRSKRNRNRNRNGKKTTGNGNWQITATATGKNAVKVIVKHLPTDRIYESTLYGDGNGLINHNNWLDLRKEFYQNDGKTPEQNDPEIVKPKSVFFDLYHKLDNGDKANFRAFLYPRLYNEISKIKAIADKID